MNIMSLIEEHKYESVCVALALLLLLALWPALTLGTKAQAQAVKARKLITTLTGLQARGPGGVANKSRVQARTLFAEQTKLEAQEVASLLKQKNQRQFLIADMFPDAKDPFGFRDKYRSGIKTLREQTLNAGWPQELSTHTETKSPSDIGVYIENLENFGVPKWIDAPNPPDAKECWFGQVAFWIQQDLSQIFRDLNLASAEREGQSPNVTNATVKLIDHIEVGDSYYVADTKQTSSSVGSFTEHVSNDQIDVLHFSFSIIIDSRYVNEFLGLFSRKNLYTILNVSLSREDVEINNRNFKMLGNSSSFNPGKDAAEDLVYGTAPVIRLDVDAELLLLREIYTKDTPEQIREALQEKIKQAQRRLREAGQPIRRAGGRGK